MILEYGVSVGIPSHFFPGLCTPQAEVLCTAWESNEILIFLQEYVLLC